MATNVQLPDVGQRIRDLRREQGLSQTGFAKKYGFGERTVQAWERNERTPRLKALTKIARRSDRPVAWFFEANGNAPKRRK